jgi:hypothetical protein
MREARLPSPAFAFRLGVIAGLAALASMIGPGAAAAAAPQIVSVSVGENSVTATGATLQGSINPGGTSTTYRFEYLTQAAFEANLEAQPPREPFAGAAPAPISGAGLVGGGTTPVPVNQHLGGLAAATSYRFRLRAIHTGEEAVFSVTRPFATAAPTNVFELLDHRGWEMVSPIDKGGGAVQPPGQVSGGGVFQAATAGASFTYSSADSFGEGAQGAPSGSQYVATRTGAGWSTTNITTPLLSGSYGSEPDGVPYQLFSGDLGSALLSGGERCRGVAGGECRVANPPLPGSGAPAGYRDYYRRGAGGTFESVLTAADLSHTPLGPTQFELRLVAATPDLAHVVLSSCAALTAEATEVTAPEGCDSADQNLYEWSGGALTSINLLPGESTATPGAEISGPSGAISSDGSRVYFTVGEALYLRDGTTTKPVLEAPGGEFVGASDDGSVAYLIDAGELAKYSAATASRTTLSSSGGVEGVLGVSADGSKVYYAQSGAVFLHGGATTTEVASSALPGDWTAGGGTSRVTRDGSHLLFLSAAELTGYPNEGKTEVFLYGPPPGGGVALLACVSCNPSGERPQGSASIPGTRPNGTGTDALDTYKPRVLSGDGERVFFETADSLVAQDTNKGSIDVYEWEAAGEGTCTRGGGCVQLISGGREATPSYFLDADESGSEAFFLTTASLYPLDPGSYDVYDAPEFGGFAVPESPIPCVADACQVLPEAPEDPSPGTLVPNAGNPTLKVAGEAAGEGKSKKKKHKKKAGHKRKAKKKHGTTKAARQR